MVETRHRNLWTKCAPHFSQDAILATIVTIYLYIHTSIYMGILLTYLLIYEILCTRHWLKNGAFEWIQYKNCQPPEETPALWAQDLCPSKTYIYVCICICMCVCVCVCVCVCAADGSGACHSRRRANTQSCPAIYIDIHIYIYIYREREREIHVYCIYMVWHAHTHKHTPHM
jgi:hypothetical protein